MITSQRTRHRAKHFSLTKNSKEFYKVQFFYTLHLNNLARTKPPGNQNPNSSCWWVHPYCQMSSFNPSTLPLREFQDVIREIHLLKPIFLDRLSTKERKSFLSKRIVNNNNAKKHLSFTKHCFKVLRSNQFNPHNKPKIGITIIPISQMHKLKPK